MDPGNDNAVARVLNESGFLSALSTISHANMGICRFGAAGSDRRRRSAARENCMYPTNDKPKIGRFAGLQRKHILFFLGLLLCFAVCTLFGCTSQEQSLVINEVVTSNKNSSIDEALGSPDWIELHNLSSSEIDLQGYILTDKDDDYSLSNMLPGVRIPAGGYVLFYARADHDDSIFCLPFGLSKGGDTLYLMDPSGNLLERIVIPALPQDVSYARRQDGSFGYCILPTPGEANGTDSDISDVCPETEPPPEEVIPEDLTPKHSETVLYLNEICSNDLPDGGFGGADWIEIFNPGDTELSLEGFFLSDRPDNPDKAPLPSVTVQAGGVIAIPCSTEPNAVDLGISSAGETMYLFDPDLALVDTVYVPALNKGVSWARNRNGVFGYCGSPTPGAKNDDALIGIEPTLAADAAEPVQLSEVLFRNTYSVIDSYGDHSDFAELYNAGREPVNLADYYLSDTFDSPLKWQCPDIVLDPGEYLLIFLSGKNSAGGEYHASFSLSSADDGLQLYRRSTRTYLRIPYQEQVPKDTSVGLTPDGSPVYYKYPTPGGPNAAVIHDINLLSAFPSDDLFISEVSAVEKTGSDWVELKNGSGSAVDLDGWVLSDKEDRTSGFRLSGRIDPGAYAVFAPDGFRISATGESLFLYDAEGHVRDVFDTGDLSEGLTSGRTDAPAIPRVFFYSPTPNASNSSDYALGRSPAPLFSDTVLYHSEPFSLQITCSDPNAVIRYTLDGNEPTEASPVYEEPILISSSVIVRAVSYRPDALPSRVIMASYVFAEPHTLPIVCIACDPARFREFTRINTISGHYPRTDAQIAFYEADGTLGTVFAAEINPRGNQSIKYPQKSLSLHLRTRLGQGSVNYPFWGDGTAADYGSLILRNGSQDYTAARLRDSFALRAVSGLGLDSAQTRPVIAYINGTYYGIMDLNECMNQDYLVTHFGVDPETVSHIAINASVKYGTDKDFQRVRKFARNNNLADDAAYEQFSQWVDVDYIIDYLIAQTYFCNYDVKNQSYWATNDYTVRWRPVFYDIDRCFTARSSYRNIFTDYFNRQGVVYDKAQNRVANMDIYAALRDNPGWCDRFVRRYAQLLCTDFSTERLQALLDEMADALRPEIQQHIELFASPSSLEEWEQHIQSMREEIDTRYTIIQEQICSEFRLPQAEWDAIMEEARQNAAS